MNIKEIEDLIKFVSKAGVSEVELECKDFKITIKTTPKQKEIVSSVGIPPTIVPQVHVPITPMPPLPVAPVVSPSERTSPPASVETKTADQSKYITIKSPMIGTFYRTPSPEKPSFVNVGDEIKAGTVICIIEAMKLFNEIEAEVSGRIVKVLVDNASPVEYDQPLFLVEPL